MYLRSSNARASACSPLLPSVCTATVKEGSSPGLPRVDLLGMVYKKRAVKKGFGGNHTPIQEFGQNLWLEYNIVTHLPYPLCKNEFQNRCLEKSSLVFLSFPWSPRTVSLQTNLYFKGTALGNAEGVPISQNRKWLDEVMVVWTHKTWLEKSWSWKVELPWMKVITLQGDSGQTNFGEHHSWDTEGLRVLNNLMSTGSSFCVVSEHYVSFMLLVLCW